MVKSPTKKCMIWHVYFRKDDDDDWEFEYSVPPLILDTFETNGETFPGGHWYGQHESEPVDLNEGRVALIVLQNRKAGLQSYYALTEIKRPQDQEPLAVTFNCIRK